MECMLGTGLASSPGRLIPKSVELTPEVGHFSLSIGLIKITDRGGLVSGEFPFSAWAEPLERIDRLPLFAENTLTAERGLFSVSGGSSRTTDRFVLVLERAPFSESNVSARPTERFVLVLESDPLSTSTRLSAKCGSLVLMRDEMGCTAVGDCITVADSELVIIGSRVGLSKWDPPSFPVNILPNFFS